ncbi:MAG: hypothetical protein ACLSVD_02595 [Eggerthellaceae bacterium]
MGERNRPWVGGIAYARREGGSFAAVTGAFSRKVVSWSMSAHHRKVAIDAIGQVVGGGQTTAASSSMTTKVRTPPAPSGDAWARWHGRSVSRPGTPLGQVAGRSSRR